MDATLLQGWTSVGGSSSLLSIPQAANLWFDLGDHEDVSFTLEVKEVTGTVSMNYETSPSPEDAYFQACVTPFAIANGVRVDSCLAAYATVPVGQYVRWRLSTPGGASWHVTFRIWVTLYSLV